MINKEKILPVLKVLQPGLSTAENVPALSCYCFTGETAHAYDDFIGITMPCATPFTGGLKGKLFQQFVNAAKKDEIITEEKDGSILFKSGRSKLELPLVPEDEFLFTVPSTKKVKSFEVSAKFIDGIQSCNLSLGADTNNAWRMGVTIAGCKAGVWLFSSDNLTTTRVTVKDATLAEKFKGKELQLSPRFCTMLVKLAKANEIKSIKFTEEWAIATFKGGLKMFGRTGNEVTASRFKQVFSMVATKEARGALIPVPEGAEGAVANALAVLSSTAEKITGVVIKKKRLSFDTNSANVSLFDTLVIKDHADIEVACPADFLQRAMKNYKSFMVQDNCVLFKKGLALHIVTTVAE